MIILLLIVLASLALLYLIVQLDVPGTWKFVLGIIEMIIVTRLIVMRYKLPTEMGLILLKSKFGLDTINSLAKRTRFWNMFADAGNAMAYGLSSMAIMKKNMNMQSLVAGLIALGIIWKFVLPTAMIFLAQLFGTTMVERVGGDVDTSSAEIFIAAVLLIGGLFLVLVLSIISYGAIVLYKTVEGVAGGTVPDVDPGGTLLLPGVNLPFFEGILALLIILVIHEGAHAILARVGKIPIHSSGLVLFGIVPIGAFVEPDEKKLMRLEKVKQTRVLVAGSTSNLAASCVLFFIFLVIALGSKELGLLEMDIVGGVARFVITALGLAFSLNFVIGTVNLLPLPFFDGYRVLELNVKNKLLVKGVMIITLVSFVLNFVPHLF